MFDRKPAAGSAAALVALRAELAPGTLATDGRLPGLNDLAARHGLDKRSARRALEVLEAEDLVWRGAGGVLFASPAAFPAAARDGTGPAIADALQEARLALEPRLVALVALVALAAQRAGVRDVTRLRGLAARATAAADADGLGLWDAALHQAVAMAAGDGWLFRACMALDTCRASLVPEAFAARRTAIEAAWSDEIAAEHRALIDAVADGDRAAVEAALRAHLMADRIGEDLALRRSASGPSPD